MHISVAVFFISTFTHCHFCIFAAASILFTRLWQLWQTLRFCTLKYYHGFGRWGFGAVFMKYELICFQFKIAVGCLLIAEIRRFCDTCWSQCRKWNTSHPWLFSWFDDLVAGTFLTFLIVLFEAEVTLGLLRSMLLGYISKSNSGHEVGVEILNRLEI